MKLFKVGRSVSFSKKVNEKDIMMFAELSGDFSPNHVDEEFMKKSVFGKRIAHGALLVGYMSKASSMICENYPSSNINATPVSLGYDHVRFIKPVFIDDTLTVTYTVEKYYPDKERSIAGIEIENQHHVLVAVAKHILQWVPDNK